MSLLELKAKLQQTAKRILKQQKPSGEAVLKEIETTIISQFNDISQKAVILFPTEDIEDIFTYARKKTIECFLALGVNYAVPKRPGQIMDVAVRLADDARCFVTYNGQSLLVKNK